MKSMDAMHDMLMYMVHNGCPKGLISLFRGREGFLGHPVFEVIIADKTQKLSPSFENQKCPFGSESYQHIFPIPLQLKTRRKIQAGT